MKEPTLLSKIIQSHVNHATVQRRRRKYWLLQRIVIGAALLFFVLLILTLWPLVRL